ncbi:hypothetical protein BD414DRAFT_96527 [Trametes punicea]|nr:hypothetical protein BD414DRAFT_96527 [Trametes punicea]
MHVRGPALDLLIMEASRGSEVTHAYFIQEFMSVLTAPPLLPVGRLSFCPSDALRKPYREAALALCRQCENQAHTVVQYIPHGMTQNSPEQRFVVAEPRLLVFSSRAKRPTLYFHVHSLAYASLDIRLANRSTKPGRLQLSARRSLFITASVGLRTYMTRIFILSNMHICVYYFCEPGTRRGLVMRSAGYPGNRGALRVVERNHMGLGGKHWDIGTRIKSMFPNAGSTCRIHGGPRQRRGILKYGIEATAR